MLIFIPLKKLENINAKKVMKEKVIENEAFYLYFCVQKFWNVVCFGRFFAFFPMDIDISMNFFVNRM